MPLHLSLSDWLTAATLLTPFFVFCVRSLLMIRAEWAANTRLTLQIRELLQGNPTSFPPIIGLVARVERLELQLNEISKQVQINGNRYRAG